MLQYTGSFRAIDASARLRGGRRFADLSLSDRIAVLENWRTGSVPRRWALRMGLTGADSLQDRNIPTFARGELPHGRV